MEQREFTIFGRWYGNEPDYTLWEILPKPKHPSPNYHPDQQWKELELPRKKMRRWEIEKFLVEKFPKSEGWKVLRLYMRSADEVFFNFHRKS